MRYRSGAATLPLLPLPGGCGGAHLPDAAPRRKSAAGRSLMSGNLCHIVAVTLTEADLRDAPSPAHQRRLRPIERMPD